MAFLGLAMYFRLSHKYVRHAVLMGAGISLHTVAIFAIMVPSLVSLDIVRNVSALTALHAIVGGAVEIMGVWLMVTWLISKADVAKCFGRKNIMRVTIALWIAELILGVFVYLMLYPLP